MKKFLQFIRESRNELGKVSWPTRSEVWDSTKVVIVSVVIVSLFLGIIDIFFNRLIKMVIG